MANKKTPSVEMIVGLLERGYRLSDIAEFAGTSVAAISTKLSSKGMSASKIRMSALVDDLEQVRKGKKHLYKVRETFGYAPSGFYNLIRQLGLADVSEKDPALTEFDVDMLREGLKSTKVTEKIHALIDSGASSTDMVEAVDRSKQWIEQYVNGTGQYNLWRSNRRRRKEAKLISILEQKNSRREILSVIRKDLEKRLEIKDSDTLDEKTDKLTAKLRLEYTNRGRVFDTPGVRKVIRKYLEAEGNGKKVSFKELGKDSGYEYPAYVRNLLLKAGKKSLFWETESVSEEKGKVMKRFRDSTFTLEDIGYFSEVNASPTTLHKFSGRGEKPGKRYNGIVYAFGPRSGTMRINYWVASEIYLAQDLGYDEEQIYEMNPNVQPEIVDKVLRDRKKISSIIIPTLRKAYPKMKINKPYLETKND